MKNRNNIIILIITLCGWINVISASYVQKSGDIYSLLALLDDYELEDLQEDEKDLSDEELITLPKILLVPSYDEDDLLALSRLGDRKIGDLGGGAAIIIDSQLRTNLVDSDQDFMPSPPLRESTIPFGLPVASGNVATPIRNRLGDWTKKDESVMSDFDLDDEGDGLSPQNEFTPASPTAIVDNRTALLASTALKQALLLSPKAISPQLIERIQRFESALVENLLSWQRFSRELENIKSDFLTA